MKTNIVYLTNNTKNFNKLKIVVCSFYKMNINDLFVKSRETEYVTIKQVSQYFAKIIFTKLSNAEIGYLFGNVDHATVFHSCKTVKNLIETDAEYRKNINELADKLSHIKPNNKTELSNDIEYVNNYKHKRAAFARHGYI